jgi:hypothetical protein
MKTLKKFLLICLVFGMLAALTACELPFELPFLDGILGGNTPPDETPDGGDEEPDDGEDEVKPLEGFVLIENGKANFRIAYMSDVGSDTVGKINKLVTQLRSLGVEIDDPVSASKSDAVTDCEILVGGNIKYRGDECSVNPRELGEKGYTIKTVGQRIVIAGGSKETTAKAFDLFVRNYMRITDKTKDIGQGIALSEDINVFVPTTYLIESVKISGNDISEYSIYYDIARLGDYNTGVMESFREKLYLNTGHYLDVVDAEGEKNIVIRCVDEVEGDENGYGFGVYVKNENLYIECAYDNAFEKAFESFAKNKIYDAVKSIVFGDSYTYYDSVSVVRYSDFGAVGDGKTDDFEAILATHKYANECGQKVLGDPGKTYYIDTDFDEEIVVKTDVDFCGATFVINDVGDSAYQNRSLAFFTWVSDYKKIYTKDADLDEAFGDERYVAKGATSIPWLANKLDRKCTVIIWNSNHKDYIRWGANVNSGSDRHEIIIVNPDGTLDPDTVTAFEYTTVTRMDISSADDAPLTVENGNFRNICCRTVVKTNFIAKYHSYHHGLAFRRSNVTAKNIDHMMLNEPDLNVTSSKDKNGDVKANSAKYGTRDESYPYTGWYNFSNGAYNCTLINSKMDGHTTYYEDKTTSSNPVPMGTYDLGMNAATHIYLKNVTQYDETGLADAKYWGVMGSNFSKNLHFDGCSFSRFDAHCGFFNGSIKNSTVGSYINMIGGGLFVLENVVRLGNSSCFIDMRNDYGSTFEGDLIIKDCTFMGYYGYNTATGGQVNEKSVRPSGYMISTGWTNVSEEYIGWDFGYTCYMPQNIVIDNFKTGIGAFYLFQNIPDVAFNNPYGESYVAPKSITIRNMDTFGIVESTGCNVLRSIPVHFEHDEK